MAGKTCQTLIPFGRDRLRAIPDRMQVRLPFGLLNKLRSFFNVLLHYCFYGMLTICLAAGRVSSKRSFRQSETWQIAPLPLGRSPVCYNMGY